MTLVPKNPTTTGQKPRSKNAALKAFYTPYANNKRRDYENFFVD